MAGAWKRLVAFLMGKSARQAEGQVEAVSGSPYRVPAEVGHDPGCASCSWLSRVGKWQPPEVVLCAGFPVECLCLHFKVGLEGLDELAEECGLRRVE